MATPPDGKRARNKRANRAAILEAARRCFLEHGYDAVTIRDVIRLSGLAAGTFYNYFPDKVNKSPGLTGARKLRKSLRNPACACG